MKLCIISSSLNPKSRSALLAQIALGDLRQLKADVDWIDLREHPMPLCDGSSVYQHETVKDLAARISAAQGILVATPVYNYDINAALKNLLENTGRQAWQNKIVGFIASAGGDGSYMSLMPFANSLMLDFRCVIVPRFVYSTYGDFTSDTIDENGELRRRIAELSQTLHRFTHALSQAPSP